MKQRLTLLLMLFSIVTTTMVAQDINAVENLLRKKYFMVYYRTDYGGWFEVKQYDKERKKIYCGVCDKNGQELLPPVYSELIRHDDYYKVTNKNGWFGIRGLHNEEILPCKYQNISDLEYTLGKSPYFYLWSNNKSGAYDHKRRMVVVPCIYDRLYFYESLNVFKVQKDNFWGVLDKDGDVLLPCNRYTELNLGYMKQKGGYCTVKVGDKEGVIDSTYREVVPCVYDDISYGYEKLKDYKICDIGKDNKNGVYDIVKQKEIVPCVYSDIIADDITRGKFFFVHRPGNTPSQPEKMGVFDPKTLSEILPCGKYSYMKNLDTEKQTVLVCKGMDFTYDEDKDKFIIHKQGKWGVYDLKKKKEIIPCKYDLLKKEEDGVYAFNKGAVIIGLDYYRGNYVYYQGGKWGYIDAMCNEIVSSQYDRVFDFKDGVAQVVKDGVNSFLEHPLKGTSLKLTNGGDGSPIDKDIPTTNKKNDNLFAFIIANENYTHFKGADYSINDGKVFAEYCKKTLGLPERNVRYYEDATYGNMVGAVKKLQDIADAYDGDAQVIFYYSGLGASDDKTAERYLLATDASMLALDKTGYDVKTLLATLNGVNVQNMWVVIDAPFSNMDKNGQPLASGRGVAIKPKEVTTDGKAIVTLSCDGSQASYSSKEYCHSLFTYALLEKMQQSKGNCTIKEMTDYATTWVKRQAMSGFDKSQTPQVIVSPLMSTQWGNVKF